jgi:hypothetical protein
MSEIIIVCGNMSSGKTTFCKRISESIGFEFISFDDRFMEEGYAATDRRKVIKKIALSLDHERDYIIDGWFTWHENWFKDSNDDSLNLLDLLVPHTITIMLMGVKRDLLIDRHNQRPFNGINGYFETLRERQDQLYKNFRKFTTSEGENKMGWIEKLLSRTEIKPSSDIYSNFHSIERCENFHIHWRNLRLVLDEEEWELFCTSLWSAYQKWCSQGKPSPVEQPDKEDPSKKDTKIKPNYLYSGKVKPKHGELPTELAIEKQIDQHYAKNMVHFHYKSLRMDLSVDEFLIIAEQIAEAADVMKNMKNKT